MKRHGSADEMPSIPVLLMCGTTSTIIGQLVSYPLALIRTRLQAQEVPMDSAQRYGLRQLFKQIYVNEGIRGLYRGLVPNICKVVPAVSISYVVYEHTKKKLIESETTWRTNNKRQSFSILIFIPKWNKHTHTRSRKKKPTEANRGKLPMKLSFKLNVLFPDLNGI